MRDFYLLLEMGEGFAGHEGQGPRFLPRALPIELERRGALPFEIEHGKWIPAGVLDAQLGNLGIAVTVHARIFQHLDPADLQAEPVVRPDQEGINARLFEIDETRDLRAHAVVDATRQDRPAANTVIQLGNRGALLALVFRLPFDEFVYLQGASPAATATVTDWKAPRPAAAAQTGTRPTAHRREIRT